MQPVPRVHALHAMHAARGQARHCVVCGIQLSRAGAAADRADPYPTCHGVACRMVVSRRSALGDAGFVHYLRTQVRQRQRHAALTAASRAREAVESRENAAAWSYLGTRVAAAEAASLRLLLPSGPHRQRRPARERRERYRAHLLRVLAAIADTPAETPAAADDAAATAPSSLPGQLCALCGGGCCTRGGDHAYLSVPTLRRFMAAQPQLSNDEVLAAYLDRVAPSTEHGSCINHTRQGCSLPRDMRSDTCNRYACESLARLQAAQRDEAPVQVVLVVRRKQDQWHRATPGLDNAVNGGAVLFESGTRRFPAASLHVCEATP